MDPTTRTVANRFILAGLNAGAEHRITLMKLLKLMFFAQGWHLAWHDRPMFHDKIEAWKYGPVVPSVYRMATSVGTEPIVSLIKGDEVPLDSESAETHRDVWEEYKKFTAGQLSWLTHQPGTPWSQVYVPSWNRVIPHSVMRDFFLSKRNKNEQSS